MALMSAAIKRGVLGSRPSASAAIAGCLYEATDTDLVYRCKDDGSGWEIYASVAYDIAVSVSGKPGAGAIVGRLVAPRAFALPASLTGSVAKADVAATGSSTFSIKKNGSEVATLNFAASGTTATFTNASEDSFSAGDVLTIVAPGSQDATLADLGIVLRGVLS